MKLPILASLLVLISTTVTVAVEPTLWDIAAARHAKILYSGVFLSERTPEDILTNDNGVDLPPFMVPV